MLQGLLEPALAKGTGDAVDVALSKYFDRTTWKDIACDFQVRVVDAKKQYIGGRMHLKNWDGSLPGPDMRLDYSTYGDSFDAIDKGKIFSGRFFNTDGPLVIIGGPVSHQGKTRRRIRHYDSRRVHAQALPLAARTNLGY